ncbi:hypothetical protein [Fodinibius sediminis]|uniref:Outer membrane protein beta-barrel domain-containing protein n=1 Tax=Fodinibius sediminis TaxID=1214077 RepID=A0A521EL37_9BACT|nr:hypothetical protein [Fodinibius sediminis]SMO84639.1 hypothetical protein SAMN06265218_11726 [Fodinibius sediminis]
MKTILFPALLFLLLISSTASGQDDTYGIKAGVQSAGAHTDPATSGRVAGFGIYGFAELSVAKGLFSTFDLGYTQRGFTNSQEETNASGERVQTVEATTRLSYLSFTGLLNTTLSASGPFYIGAGPRFDYLIDTSPGKYEFTSASVEDHTAEALKNVVVGGSVVAGIKNLEISHAAFRVEVKYEIDISDSFGSSPFTYRNNALMLVLGVTL